MTGNKKIKCDLCDKMVAYSNMSKHKKTHDADTKKYSCENCDYSTIREDNLKLHLKNEVCTKALCLYCDELVAGCDLKKHILTEEHKECQIKCEFRGLNNEHKNDQKWLIKCMTRNKQRNCVKYVPKMNYLKRKSRTMANTCMSNEIIESKPVDNCYNLLLFIKLNEELYNNQAIRIKQSEIKKYEMVGDGFTIILKKPNIDGVNIICYCNNGCPCITGFKGEINGDPIYNIDCEEELMSGSLLV